MEAGMPVWKRWIDCELCLGPGTMVLEVDSYSEEEVGSECGHCGLSRGDAPALAEENNLIYRGAGWYEFPDGSRVRGREAALAHLSAPSPSSTTRSSTTSSPSSKTTTTTKKSAPRHRRTTSSTTSSSSTTADE